MHPWASYLITKDLLERRDRRRPSVPSSAVEPRTAHRSSAALGSRPVRAMGCVA
ncbi:hypothetical protein [Mumia quercus]|uniref:hypothetical protein n=1 Tax=Mumia quercus TaxID=2976125 RepID=UPI0021D226F8|nr:hypothetical protein [Mumia quercus]